jgi:hypothetical protein
VLQTIDAEFDRIEGVRVAKVGGHRDALVHKFNDRFGGVGRHGEIEFDPVHPGLEQMANLVGHRVHRWNAVKDLAELPAKTLVPSVEPRTQDEQSRTKLPAAVQIGPEPQNLFQLATDVARSGHPGG